MNHVWLLNHHVDRQVNLHLCVVFGVFGHHYSVFELLCKAMPQDWSLESGRGVAGGSTHRVSTIFSSVSPMKMTIAGGSTGLFLLLSQQVESSEIVGDGTCWPGFPPHNGISRQCGYADHSPLWARIKLDCWVKKLQVGVRFGAGNENHMNYMIWIHSEWLDQGAWQGD